ncbi:MAG TPA: FKBP-type peptidyl-prolyl cis-trans isomerase [Lysobacter sp.]|nr:FKBP-type peptidyl-prolyl cis-trans isomerase [Lysobacter sp.]
MKAYLRGVAVLLLGAAATLGVVSAQTTAAAGKTSLATERDKVSYAIGVDVSNSLKAVAPDLDPAAFERALRNAFGGGQPLLTDAEIAQLGRDLVIRIQARGGKPPADGKVPEVAKDKVGLLVGGDVGRSLAPIKDELDIAVFMQALRAGMGGAQPLMSDAEVQSTLQAFSGRMRTKLEAEARAKGERNKADGAAFLAKNRSVKGVVTTASGLQYMVLRQGNGPRPKATDRVRVNYRGTLLDGKEFDSSYGRGQPAEFPLDRVIPGWTEGVALMPVGSKYRFWIPAELAYGAGGTPDGSVPPNAVLVFDVELMAIL